jgi:hypothetical protein
MTATLPKLNTPAQAAAGPLAGVARALGESPDSLSPCVTAAALILAAEQLTTQAEACECAAAEGGLCEACQQLSRDALEYRQLAEQLQLAGAR